MAVRHKDLRILIGRPRLETRLRRFLGLASLSLVEVSGQTDLKGHNLWKLHRQICLITPLLQNLINYL
ncbi:hypothetical protein NC652_023429 [Populus alba x Populus x berolinensis]|uniref:Uncharacterized protein n=1 Tax=Populus alba x Populus x berolinensis TaxID=444605 RepID=A0AAD6MGH7_9ROSI|nr:hypothetical protein NC652_023429 [Populus alba x Populus x berolinensis]KAJ6985078.1 hypothetical protein NC653_023152 [Populus alba x Populus x berolinensis]KAJ6985083.1 hypothetical protein NC653_023156 [Populus alba x Populus x berolinensis]